MARGSIAKQNVENKLAVCFGNDFIGSVGGKLYVWANDGNERVQIALAMTCPKTFVEAPEGKSTSEDHTDWDFEAMSMTAEKPAPKEPAKITEAEQDAIRAMMERLGL